MASADVTVTITPDIRPFRAVAAAPQIANRVAALSRWIDESPANAGRDREAAMWGRCAKVNEEGGEVITALIGATGQNPRKGVTGDLDEVIKELLDVALTGLAAVEHMTGNTGKSFDMFLDHLDFIMARSGLESQAAEEEDVPHTIHDAADDLVQATHG